LFDKSETYAQNVHMSWQRRWEKRGNRYAVYDVEFRYDPSIKNSRQLQKVYVGMTDEHGGEPEKKRKYDVDGIYEYGFNAYIERLQEQYDIWTSLLEILDEASQRKLMICTMFLLSNRLSIENLFEWQRWQWYREQHNVVIDSMEHLRSFLGEVGEKIERAKKKVTFNISYQNNFVFSGFRALKEVQTVGTDIDFDSFFSGNTEYYKKGLELHLFSELNDIDWKVIPIRESKNTNELLRNIYLVRIKEVTEGNLDKIKAD